MRNPDRIDGFCKRLADMWKCVPDWRFGQFLSNILGDYYANVQKDFFFPEDEEFFTDLENIFYANFDSEQGEVS